MMNFLVIWKQCDSDVTLELIKQLLNSLLAKRCDLSVTRRSVIYLSSSSARHRQITTDILLDIVQQFINICYLSHHAYFVGKRKSIF